MVIDRRKVESALLSKGFKQSETHHHYFIYYLISGKKTPVKTKTSHSPKEKSIDAARLNQMAGQCRLETAEFVNLVECPLDRDTYERLLQDKGLA